MGKFFLFWAIVVILGIIGEIRCIYKLVTSDFDPIGKREIIYGIGCFSYGPVIGWFDIEDSKPTGQ